MNISLKHATVALILASALGFVLAAAAQVSSKTDVSVSTVNGQTSVTLNGAIVWTGKAVNPRSFSSAVNGEQLAAVLDGDEVLWENTPGAAARLQAQQASAGALGGKSRKGVPGQPVPPSGNTSTSSISSTTANGETVVIYQGKEVWRGKADGPVVTRATTFQGKSYGAALAGDKVLWESEPGAASVIKQP
jgi:hypothetical protein